MLDRKLEYKASPVSYPDKYLEKETISIVSLQMHEIAFKLLQYCSVKSFKDPIPQCSTGLYQARVPPESREEQVLEETGNVLRYTATYGYVHMTYWGVLQFYALRSLTVLSSAMVAPGTFRSAERNVEPWKAPASSLSDRPQPSLSYFFATRLNKQLYHSTSPSNVSLRSLSTIRLSQKSCDHHPNNIDHSYKTPSTIMSDYASLKVPDLKKLLSERSLPQSGNKADLIARLQENDKSMF